MTDNEARLLALEIAREITPAGDAELLIANALRIESHLLGKPEQDYVDFRSAEGNKSDTDWSGTAQDLFRLCDTGNVLVCKSRQVGMTTFLTDYAVKKTTAGEKVLFFTTNGSMVKVVQKTFADLGGDVAKIDFVPLNRYGDFPTRGTAYDHVIVDGLAYLAYAKETEFLTSVMPCSKHFIFASEPAQARGLFHDLWKNSVSFQKVVLTWNTPLLVAEADRQKRLETIKESLGEERFRNEFECEFRNPQE